MTDRDDTVESYTSISASQAQLQSIKTRNGYKQTLHHNSDQTLASVTDSYNRSLSFAYQNGLLKTVTTPENVLSFGYTATGSQNLLTSVSYSTTPVTTVTYIYDNPSLPTYLTGIVDENGNRFATWTYDSQGRALTSQHGSSAELTTVTYNDTDNSRTVTNALGVTDTYSFSLMQGVPKVTKISRAATATTAAATRAFTYDSNGYTNGTTDWNGNSTIYTNNAHGQPTTITEAFGTSAARTTNITYDPVWVHLPSTIATPGLTAAFSYDASGNIQSKTLTDTTTTAAPYSTKGTARTWNYGWTNYLLTSVTSPRTDVSAVTSFGYSSTGALTSYTNALKQQTTIKTYTAGGRPLTIVDPNNVTTQLAYDGRQRETSKTVTTAAGPLKTSYIFDPAGNRTGITQPDGSTLTTAFDPAHRPIKVTDSLGNYVKFTLDALDDRTQTNIYKADGTLKWTQSTTFDALGRPQVITSGAGQTTTEAFDLDGNLLSVTDGRGLQTTNTYDALNRISTSTDANGGVTTTIFDPHDLIVAVTDPNNNSTAYTRDGFGDVIQRVSPDSGTALFHVDADGNTISKTDAKGIVTNQSFDALDRILTKTYPASSAENVTFTYDQSVAGINFGIGRLGLVKDQAGSEGRQYDELGRLTRDQRVNGATTLTTGYGYDKASRIASTTYPDGVLIGFQHDAAGYTTAVTAKLPGAVTAKTLATFDHEPFGSLDAVVYGNGVAESWTFDQSYRPSQIADALSGVSLQNLAYNYDGANNVSSITDAVNSANSQTFEYDPVDRLTGAVSGPGGYGSFAWRYDKNGNRQSEVHGATTTTYGYTPGSNQLAAITTTAPVAALAPSNLLLPHTKQQNQVYSASGGFSSGAELLSPLSSIAEQPPLKTVAGTENVRQRFERLSFSGLAPRMIYAAYPPAYEHEAQSPSLSPPHPTPIPPPVIRNPPVIQPPTPIVPPIHLQPPSFTPVAGVYIGTQAVTLADATANVAIFYTLDGSTPTASSTRYTGPITVSRATTIKALAVSGNSTSGVASASYTIEAQTVATVLTDLNGNITSIPPANSAANATFGYNNAGRLSQVTGSPMAATYLYDAWGQRISKANPGTPATLYGYAQDGSIQMENDGGTVTDYVYVDGRPIAQIQPGASPAANQVSYVLADRLGTPQRLVNASGATVWSTTYQPFGTTGTINATVNQSLRFPGQYNDAETGFSYNHFRDYAPNLGRYLETDPTGLFGGVNTYGYAHANPFANIDPSGLCPSYAPDCIEPIYPVETIIGFFASDGLLPEVRSILQAIRTARNINNAMETPANLVEPPAEPCVLTSQEPPSTSVFHGSISDGPEILENGFDPNRGTVFVSPDSNAAIDALLNHPDANSGVGTLIESRIPTDQYNSLLSPFERPYNGFYPYSINSTEIPLRTPEQIQLFNQYIVK